MRIFEITSYAIASIHVRVNVRLCDIGQESTIASLREWLADPTAGNNATVRLIAGTIFMHEEDYSEALKHTHSGGTMDL